MSIHVQNQQIDSQDFPPNRPPQKTCSVDSMRNKDKPECLAKRLRRLSSLSLSTHRFPQVGRCVETHSPSSGKTILLILYKHFPHDANKSSSTSPKPWSTRAFFPDARLEPSLRAVRTTLTRFRKTADCEDYKESTEIRDGYIRRENKNDIERTTLTSVG
jgi:hypothetical protein